MEQKNNDLTHFNCSIRILIECFSNKTIDFLIEQLNKYFKFFIKTPETSISLVKTVTSPDQISTNFQKRVLSPNAMICSELELANFVYLPVNQSISKLTSTADTKGSYIPPELIENFQKAGLINIGKIISTDKTDLVFGIKPHYLNKGLIILGNRKQGKTTFLKNILCQNIELTNSKHFIFDPTGSLSHLLLEHFSNQTDKKILVLDISKTPDLALFCSNPFDNSPFPELVKETYLNLFKLVYPNYFGSNKENLLNYLLDTLLELGGSIYDLPYLLTNTQYRQLFLVNLSNPNLINFWGNEFPKLESQILQN